MTFSQAEEEWCPSAVVLLLFLLFCFLQNQSIMSSCFFCQPGSVCQALAPNALPQNPQMPFVWRIQCSGNARLACLSLPFLRKTLPFNRWSTVKSAVFDAWITSCPLYWQLLEETNHTWDKSSHTITIRPLPGQKEEANRLFWMWIWRALQKATTTLSVSALTVLVVRLLFLPFHESGRGWNYYFCFDWLTILKNAWLTHTLVIVVWRWRICWERSLSLHIWPHTSRTTLY